MATLRALWMILRGKRVRGWNLLYLAAADHPFYYDSWVKRGEPHAIRTFCANRQPGHMPTIGCVVLGTGDNADAKKTVSSIRRALPGTTAIWTNVPELAADDVTLIATATSLKDALGRMDSSIEWLLPLQAGDKVSPALGKVLRHAPIDPASQTIVFWDEDTLRDGCRQSPWIKPGWDPVLFRVRDGVTGAALIATRALRYHAARNDERINTADFTWFTRCILNEESIDLLHIPLILTHRSNGAPFVPCMERTNAAPEQTGVLAPITPEKWPVVSIIIPTRDRADLLETCLTGLARLDYPGDVELLIVDNNSVEAETLVLFARAERDGARILAHPGAFNYAALINQAASVARGDMLCLLNNDIELRDTDWLMHMVRYAMLSGVGAVGARLLYPGGEIQHAGIAIGIGDAAGHVQKGIHPTDPRFTDWHALSRIVSAVTGACLVVARAKFEAVDGLDAVGFAVDFNDVDFCLRLQAMGLVNIFAAEATLVHHESESRGHARCPESAARFARELDLLRTRWQTVGFDDPHYSPLFRRECERCVLAF